MIARFNLIPTLLAVILFCLPWTEISCQDKTIARQSGIQMMTGDFTAVEQTFTKTTITYDEDGNRIGHGSRTFTVDQATLESNADQSNLHAPLLIAAFVCIVLATISSGVAVYRSTRVLSVLSLAFPVLGLILLTIQFAIGLPSHKAIAQFSVPQPLSTASDSLNPAPEALASLGQQMMDEMVRDLRIKVNLPLYGVFAALLLSSVLFVAYLIREKGHALANENEGQG